MPLGNESEVRVEEVTMMAKSDLQEEGAIPVVSLRNSFTISVRSPAMTELSSEFSVDSARNPDDWPNPAALILYDGRFRVTIFLSRMLDSGEACIRCMCLFTEKGGSPCNCKLSGAMRLSLHLPLWQDGLHEQALMNFRVIIEQNSSYCKSCLQLVNAGKPPVDPCMDCVSTSGSVHGLAMKRLQPLTSPKGPVMIKLGFSVHDDDKLVEIGEGLVELRGKAFASNTATRREQLSIKRKHKECQQLAAALIDQNVAQSKRKSGDSSQMGDHDNSHSPPQSGMARAAYRLANSNTNIPQHQQHIQQLTDYQAPYQSPSSTLGQFSQAQLEQPPPLLSPLQHPFHYLPGPQQPQQQLLVHPNLPQPPLLCMPQQSQQSQQSQQHTFHGAGNMRPFVQVPLMAPQLIAGPIYRQLTSMPYFPMPGLILPSQLPHGAAVSAACTVSLVPVIATADTAPATTSMGAVAAAISADHASAPVAEAAAVSKGRTTATASGAAASSFSTTMQAHNTRIGAGQTVSEVTFNQLMDQELRIMQQAGLEGSPLQQLMQSAASLCGSAWFQYLQTRNAFFNSSNAGGNNNSGDNGTSPHRTPASPP